MRKRLGRDEKMVQMATEEERGRVVWILAVLQQQYDAELAHIAKTERITTEDMRREAICQGASEALKAALQMVKGEAQP